MFSDTTAQQNVKPGAEQKPKFGFSYEEGRTVALKLWGPNNPDASYLDQLSNDVKQRHCAVSDCVHEPSLSSPHRRSMLEVSLELKARICYNKELG